MIRRGRVIAGDGLGRTIGYPTANLDIAERRFPPMGVYAVKVSGGGLHGRLGVSNVGTRPTVGGKKATIEIHIPGFSGSLYGNTLTVSFIQRIRGEKKFPSIKVLQTQIEQDIETALNLDLKAAAGSRQTLGPKKTSRASVYLRARPKKG